MQGHIRKEEIIYNGDQLTSLFNYRATKEVGDSILAFKGMMDVTADHMVDIEDVIENDFIYSPKAVNFIIELFDISLESTILYQRAFMQIIANALNTDFLKERAIVPYQVQLDGDDIFILKIKTPPGKLSVSIATISKISGLIHTGLNLELDSKVPVFAACLGDLFAKEVQDTLIAIVVNDFCAYVDEIKRCKYKVLGV